MDSPQFLWVSDGKLIWGVDATINRVSQFQASEVWRIEPHLNQARVVDIKEGSAFLQTPLDLVIGSAKAPDRLEFLIIILCVKQSAGWKIAALFTTANMP